MTVILLQGPASASITVVSACPRQSPRLERALTGDDTSTDVHTRLSFTYICRRPPRCTIIPVDIHLLLLPTANCLLAVSFHTPASCL
jgi:hypothetical protein